MTIVSKRSNTSKLLRYAQSYMTRVANCIFQSGRKKSVCVVILTKSVGENLQLIRAIEGYRLNSSGVQFCVVESGDTLCNLDVEYYIRPSDEFHYNRFLWHAFETIPIQAFDFVVISNDDVIPLMGALDELVNSTFVSCSPVDPSVTRTKSLRRPVIGYEVEYHVCGWCLCISTELFKRIDYKVLFDERYSFFLQDVYYAKLLALMDIVHAVIPSAWVVHLEHRSHSLASGSLLADRELDLHLDEHVQFTARQLLDGR
jgi:hypothetical protein